MMILPRVHCHSLAASGAARPAPAAPSRRAKGTTTTGLRRPLGLRNVKRANLTASRKETVKVPTYEDVSCVRSYRISQFLSHPSGMESMLKARAMESYLLIDSTTYRFSRCVLPTVNILDYEATPVLDLRLTLTSEDCKVEMLSCKVKLNGSEVVECQNNHYKAYMTNHIRWMTDDLEDFLEVDVELGLVLEIVMLAASAVEIPGNVAMQAVVDRLVQLLLKHLLEDYRQWVCHQVVLDQAIIFSLNEFKEFISFPNLTVHSL